MLLILPKEFKMQSQPSHFSKSELPLPPFYLSHHYTEEAERCFCWSNRYYCRRCFVLYPLMFLLIGFALGDFWLWPSQDDSIWLCILPLPAVIEFVCEQLRYFSYSSTRQIITTLFLAPALGKGFARYLENQGDLLFWGMVLTYGGICVSALWIRKIYLPKNPSQKNS